MKIKILTILLVCITASLSYARDRQPAVAGAFYPDNPESLRNLINSYIKNADLDKAGLPKGNVFGLICPHAGYPYSGPAAGYSYKLLEGQAYDTVIILGVNHRAYGFTNISVWNKGNFKTPLGDIPIDTELADAIINENPKKYVFFTEAQKAEHSIEVQLPFLQVVLKNFKLVPIVLGDYSEDACKQLADAILKHIGSKKVLIIASTDLSHDKSYNTANLMDALGLKCAVDIDIEGLVKEESAGKTEMCGFGPVLTLLYAVKSVSNIKGVLLKYANSGDTTGDKNGRIVGYGAVAFLRTQINADEEKQIAADKDSELKNKNLEQIKKEGNDMQKGEYTIDEKKALLKLARDTISDYLSDKKTEKKDVVLDKFKESRGVFVTLNEFGELRGCIGYIEPIKPLQQAVIDNAIHSAAQDPRFTPVSLKELPNIEIEISVLTPPVEVKGPEDFIAGRHGIIIKKGFYNAVFLPQVAPEQGWTREETLSHLCMKAGLAPDEWKKPGMKFLVFTAEVFSEKEVK